ncbi:class I SAM-dependent methyltransferase [Alteribacter natronophilus]|uniref:class I SAM-dependent methyltransferase n=1 Tax=Alteribacter natronophilus TaxID=2583810 RepID=UPI00110E2F18|nr:class I SAM-dependent methyltransferase [Alteribacter natronophilus]TMW72903.1 class I SAM-dependent methyltransferase [Alteribacter natronophilus]
MDYIEYNRRAWDKKVDQGVKYTRCVDSATIERARNDDWEITVTTDKPVPRDWFPESLKDQRVLCLASGGGQQGPVLAAAGADVTVLDVSEKQLGQDRSVAERENLSLKTVQGTMTDLSRFEDESFDIVVNPVSNLFIKDIRPVWKGAARVLKQGGTMITGFTNPIVFMFDPNEEAKGRLVVSNPIPGSTLDGLSYEEKQAAIESGEPVQFSHTLEDQLQGQADAGLLIAGFFEDDFGGSRPLDRYSRSFIATRALKMG